LTAKVRGGRSAPRFYRAKPNGGFERLKPDYHDGANEIRKDLSAPVLVFDKKLTWYFGDKPQPLPDALIALAAKGQGHRVKLRLPGDLEVLRAWLKRIGPPGIYGRPREEAKAGDCGG
jgi:hypothetical protein